MSDRPSVNALLEPQLLDVLRNLKQEIFRTMNCVKLGTIQSFNQTNQTAEVALLFKRVLDDGTIAEYPILVDCPVITAQGGGGSLTFPIASGDQCVVFFSDRNLDAWIQNGTAAQPPTARCHDLSDGLCLVGVNAATHALTTYETSVSQWAFDGGLVRMDGQKVILSRDGATVIIKNGLITLANNTTNLLTLIDGFIDVLKALTVQFSPSPLPLTAASIAALEALKAQFAGLLQ